MRGDTCSPILMVRRAIEREREMRDSRATAGGVRARISGPGICGGFPRGKSDDTSRTRRVSATPAGCHDRLLPFVNGLSALRD